MGTPKTKDDLDGILGEAPADEPVNIDTIADEAVPEEALTETPGTDPDRDIEDLQSEPSPDAYAAPDMAAAEVQADAAAEAGFAENGAGFQGAPSAEADADLAARIATAEAERDDMRDRFMRALAEAENARKRSDKDRREAERYGGSRLARDLLPVYDNLTRALAAAQEENASTQKALVEGLELTLREFINVFGKHGVTPISPETGDTFDPQLHQAMFEAPVPGTKAGEIIQVMTQGFLLHDRLLRPAQVGVSSTPAG